MAHHWMDNVHTTAFSPRDYQVELLAAAREKNTLICLGHNSSKEFIALKLIHELAHQVRTLASATGQQQQPPPPPQRHTLYLCADGQSAYNQIFHLTDLTVANLNDSPSPIDWPAQLAAAHVLILSPQLCLRALRSGQLRLGAVNLLCIADCHLSQFRGDLCAILDEYVSPLVPEAEAPLILGLAGPLHSAGCPPGHLAAELRMLESQMRCRAESASDIVTVLRYCSAPRELLVECAPVADGGVGGAAGQLSALLRDLVRTRLAWLRQHRFDPSEIYSDEFLEEMQSYPDPKAEPMALLRDFLEVLDELGVWCADRAALTALHSIEKLKVKTPYERHFLLLCMVSTMFVQVRAHCHEAFARCPATTDRERIELYSTPKVLRLLEVLRLFRTGGSAAADSALASANNNARPAAGPRQTSARTVRANVRTAPALAALDALNFAACGQAATELQVQLQHDNQPPATTEAMDVHKLTRNLQRMLPPSACPHPPALRPTHNQRGRGPRPGWTQRLEDPNALCGLLFCDSRLIAKCLYQLLSEMSRQSVADLGYLSVQFTVDRQADPLTEPKEAEAEHRRQEDVLRRFRMHDCNLLIGTPVLEEGIDLPKCNLVMRWNAPRTYRSYVQCKGRARAPNAFHIVMVGSKAMRASAAADEEPERESTGSYSLSDHNHRLVCEQPQLKQEGGASDDASICKLAATSNADEASAAREAVRFQQLQQMQLITAAQVDEMAKYMHIEQLLLRQCENNEPTLAEQQHADRFTALLDAYRPAVATAATTATTGVTLATAIALLNKYCAKLPSDTFTKLTPLWRCARTERPGSGSASSTLYLYTLRLPINSPVKQDILGLPMPTRILARRVAALIACRTLHLSGELDGNLQPIGKESFRATEPDWEDFELEPADEAICSGNQEPRPGTTKRRQYYYKRIAEAFCDCRPRVDTECYLYLIRMTLECPIPEEQNTRGRRIYPPEEAAQGFGILTSKPIPKISSFPIFTRSGEVKVSLELVGRRVQFDARKLQHINTFLNFTFTKVLRLQKYLMLFDAEASENSFYIVPTLRAKTDGAINVDWSFLEMIAGAHGRMPVPVPEPQRRTAGFDVEQWRDAVVMPWYRNQDQPQYFYVAEICEHLSPESAFPGDHYSTFREYYGRKYGINIQNQRQPLLDVDHTSARLNFLTPRYVNRKGVALPTSSEETKRAKRENLEQKQILVPELCTIHPFPASLWRAAVCLPCILYRFNALLLADEIRVQVAHDLGGNGGVNGHRNGDNSAAGEVIGRLAQEEVVAAADFEWPMLNFGWTLVEVLRKSREAKAAKLVLNSSAGSAETGGEVRENGRAAKEKEAKVAKTESGGSGKREAGDDELEIGTWTNEMADDLELSGGSFDSGQNEIPGLPANVKMCSSVDSRVRYGSPTSWNAAGLPTANNGGNPRPAANTSGGRNSGYFSDLDDSFGSDCSDDDDDDDGDFDSDFAENTDSDADGALKIEFQSDHVAEAIESEEEIQRRQRQLEIIQTINASEKAYQEQKNIGLGYDAYGGERTVDDDKDASFASSIAEQAGRFDVAIDKFRQRITGSSNGDSGDSGDAAEMLVRHDESLQPRIGSRQTATTAETVAISEMSPSQRLALLAELLPFVGDTELQTYSDRAQPISLDDLFALHRTFLERTPLETYTIEGTGDLFDQFNYSPFDTATTAGDRSPTSAKTMQMPAAEFFRDRVVRRVRNTRGSRYSQIATTKPLPAAEAASGAARPPFSFDAQPDLSRHPGPSPSVILQALTMSNANDGINLERLETIGDSFLKYAITTYLYCTYEDVHEGKLSHLRSKQVSNLNLYRLGRRKMFGECMIATKFEPQDNWLPPCYYVPKELEKALIAAGIPAYHWNLADLPNIKELSSEQICALVKRKADAIDQSEQSLGVTVVERVREEAATATVAADSAAGGSDERRAGSAAAEAGESDDNYTCFIPYNLVTQHSIPDKSVADCVEALIGAYLIECGQRGALLFMAWLGIRVLPCVEAVAEADKVPVEQQSSPTEWDATAAPCSSASASIYGHWSLPKSPLLTHTAHPHRTLDRLLNGYERFEAAIGYTFRDRSYLLQSMTHASYSANRLTDCYQRLEFLGDAVLDYLITRHLYEDPRQHSPGALTDLRSALVNNTIFASLAVRHGFHKYFRHLSPGLNDVIERFVRIQHENGHRISEEFYLISEDECDEAEDVEVPKALGDVFESVAGAIFLDSNMSLDTVWRIYSNMMRPEIELFSNSVPKSPIRELLEMEPETAKFSKPEKLTDGRRVRVSVEVFGKGIFRGIGRNYRIAKCTAAKCALRQLKKQGLMRK